MPNFNSPNSDKSNLENLKKQAKQYLHWHRERYYPVAARIRAALPRFRDLSDAQILEAKFKLADAQALVAREQGFESWQALKSAGRFMTTRVMTPEKARQAGHAMGPTNDCHPERSEGPVHFACGANAAGDSRQDDKSMPRASSILNSTEAQLFVANIKTSCDFYTGKLGFTIAFVYGDPPFYGQVKRDEAKLNLRMICEPVFAGDIREREHLLSATLTVAGAGEIKRLFLSYQAAGVHFHQPLKKEPWGARTFIVRDPDGNLILFAGPLIAGPAD